MVDVIHFGFVFACIFGLFTMSAIILFGQDLSEFSNFARASDASFHVLLGDFDWEVMQHVDRLLAMVWFWMFMWLINLVMLNMLLAIVMDVYTEVRGKIGSKAETLWSQSYEIYRRRRELKAGKRVGLDYILACIAPKNGPALGIHGQRVKISEVMAMVPGLGEHQARRILTESLVRQEEALVVSQSMAEAMLGVQRIEKRVDSMHESMKNLVVMQEMLSRSSTGAAEARQTIIAETVVEIVEPVLQEKADEKMAHVDREELKELKCLVAASVQRLDQLSLDVADLALVARANARPNFLPPQPAAAHLCGSFTKAQPFPNQ